MPAYRKKPIVIEARQFDGSVASARELVEWAGYNVKNERHIEPEIISDRYTCNLMVRTLEGPLRASPGDWIVRGLRGEFYPIKDDIFKATYDPEEGSVNTGPMPFSAALAHLNAGRKVARAGWNGKGMWLLRVDHWVATIGGPSLAARGLSQSPWVGMRTADGNFVPWTVSQTDLLANDWSVVCETVWPEDERTAPDRV